MSWARRGQEEEGKLKLSRGFSNLFATGPNKLQIGQTLQLSTLKELYEGHYSSSACVACKWQNYAKRKAESEMFRKQKLNVFTLTQRVEVKECVCVCVYVLRFKLMPPTPYQLPDSKTGKRSTGRMCDKRLTKPLTNFADWVQKQQHKYDLNKSNVN